MEEMKTEGFNIVSFTFGEPCEVIVQGAELQSIIGQTLLFDTPEGKLSTTTSLIAISPDEGTSWHYFDSAGRELASLRSDMPNLTDKPVIPPAEPLHAVQ